MALNGVVWMVVASHESGMLPGVVLLGQPIYFYLLAFDGNSPHTDLFQPLANDLLSAKAIYTKKPIMVQGTTTLRLIPDFKSLNAFLAAARFTEAAAFQGLPDPPFVDAGWTSAQFLAEDSGTMSSVSVDMTGIRTKANCAAPSSMPKVDTSKPANFSVTASLVNGCSSVVTLDLTSVEKQYGMAPGDLASCGLVPDLSQQFTPVMFWFYPPV
ncbi:hypothetical protein BDY19DRAFT_910382 [Irpex rosettiformis]|uniref:Uncharacterized protein n=1 Tax=Irpex rosettiformis TaxID=378272 RepID=A0ACB8TP28_9APHY|nr:hypothetical protein BDY19DRAFT_910382 [Irpex rosettiformis]